MHRMVVHPTSKVCFQLTRGPNPLKRIHGYAIGSFKNASMRDEQITVKAAACFGSKLK